MDYFKKINTFLKHVFFDIVFGIFIHKGIVIGIVLILEL